MKKFIIVLLSLAFIVCGIDPLTGPANKPPVISGITASTTNARIGEIVTLKGLATDPEGNDLTFSWTSSSGSLSSSTGDSVDWTAPNQADTSTIKLSVNDGNSISADSISIITDSTGASIGAPATPAAPNGPTSGVMGASIDFSASTTDPEGDRVKFEFEWGDSTSNNISDLFPSGTSVTESHSYSSPGSFSVKVRAIDEKDSTSAWSEGLVILIELSDGETGTMTDIDGNEYNTVKIGDQEWMSENLKVTKYSNGEPIRTNLSDSEWSSTSEGAYAAYNNDENNAETYGYLYNWNAVDDPNSLAPEGWHVPTDEEWKELEKYLGMSQAEADAEINRGTDEGDKLKEAGTNNWNNPNTEPTNESGFTALPGGVRSGEEDKFMEENAYFWSATDNKSIGPWARALQNSESGILRYTFSNSSGMSVRLVKGDAPTNQPPTASIQAPIDGAEYAEISSVTFTGSATDAEDGLITGLLLIWTSDKDGIIGSGTTFITSGLSVNTHVITLTAIDSDAATGTASITINVTSSSSGETGTMTDIDGNVYNTVKIGDQVWMSENLKVTKYSNGEPIKTGLSDAEWSSTTEGAYAAYDNDESNADTYGYLYNGYAVDDSMNLAPEGWHIPTDDELKELEISLGMSQAEADAEAKRGTYEGGKLKETGTSHWNSPNTGATNESGYNALPAGSRTDGFSELGRIAIIWSATESTSEDSAWYRTLTFNSSRVGRTDTDKNSGFSIRLIKGDAPTNQAPIASIQAPIDRANYPEGASVTFTGSATDAEDVLLTGSSLVWTSDKDGSLGTGESFSTSSLSVNTHVITLTAIDSDEAIDTTSITITITDVNQQPVVSISAPEDGATYTDSVSVAFTGSATDAEDGSLTDSSLVWTSDKDGQIGTGTTFSTDSLSVNMHVITLTATDSDGATGTKSITITVSWPNQSPVASIQAPIEGAFYLDGTSVTFTGSATDAEDGSLTGSSLVWTSDKDGSLGTGTTFSTSSLSVNTHVITLTASDSDAAIDTSSITITVTTSYGGETGTMTDVDGNVYITLKIGDKEWMTENLKVTKYSNGEPIQTNLSNSEWSNTTEGAYAAYNNDESSADTYGYLYNWYAVNDSNRIAPEGWHIPTDEEWKAIEMSLGMSQAEADAKADRGTDEGGKLKEAGTAHWNSPNTGATNESGFTALPGGIRSDNTGEFIKLGEGAYFWTATDDISGPLARILAAISAFINRNNADKNSGYSIRFVRDTGASNQAPTASIQIPADGATFTEDISVTFTGSATDAEDGSLTGSSLVWTSDKDGSLGAGTTVTTSGLSVNTHIITLTVTDSDGATVAANITINITAATNQAPTASILSPVDGVTYTEGDSVTFTGTASDPEDGVLPDSVLVWTSDKDGSIGTGASISTDSLSVNTHIITLTVTDSAGATGAASISITVTAANQAPTASILTPVDGVTYTENDSITFTGSASDAEDGTLTGSSLVWTSNKDGQIGTGVSFSTSGLSVNTHVIILAVTDSEGATGAASITITITASNEQPVASISAPLNGATFTEITIVTFTGSATDAEDGSLTDSSLVWTSDIDDSLGTGTSFSTSSLSVNTHVITLTATDSEGATDSTSITITVTASVDGETSTMTDIDGNVYTTVLIGDQEWMAENLKVTHYRNGVAIPNVTSNAEWTTQVTSAYAAYDNVESNADSLGYLYNWYAVDDSMNLAPEGWHVPTDEEWKELEMYLGMSQTVADTENIRGTDEGDKLKAATWGGGTNESGFTALPGGQRDSNGNYNNLSGTSCYFWSSSEFPPFFPWYRILKNDSGVGRYYTFRNLGMSVRLVKDK